MVWNHLPRGNSFKINKKHKQTFGESPNSKISKLDQKLVFKSSLKIPKATMHKSPVIYEYVFKPGLQQIQSQEAESHISLLVCVLSDADLTM